MVGWGLKLVFLSPLFSDTSDTDISALKLLARHRGCSPAPTVSPLALPTEYRRRSQRCPSRRRSPPPTSPTHPRRLGVYGGRLQHAAAKCPGRRSGGQPAVECCPRKANMPLLISRRVSNTTVREPSGHTPALGYTYRDKSKSHSEFGIRGPERGGPCP